MVKLEIDKTQISTMGSQYIIIIPKELHPDLSKHGLLNKKLAVTIIAEEFKQ